MLPFQFCYAIRRIYDKSTDFELNLDLVQTNEWEGQYKHLKNNPKLVVDELRKQKRIASNENFVCHSEKMCKISLFLL